MASFGHHALAIIGSSPYARRGLLWDGYAKYFGKPDAANLVWQAGSKTINPTISDQFLAEEFEADPISASAEYDARFRTDIEAFLTREVVEAAILRGTYEIAPSDQHSYVGFIDPSGGSSDSFTMAIAHADGDRVILDAVRERTPPFSPEEVVREFSALLKSYRISRVYGDRYGGAWPEERLRIHGLSYDQ